MELFTLVRSQHNTTDLVTVDIQVIGPLVTKAAFHASPQLYAEPGQAIFKQMI